MSSEFGFLITAYQVAQTHYTKLSDHLPNELRRSLNRKSEAPSLPSTFRLSRHEHTHDSTLIDTRTTESMSSLYCHSSRQPAFTTTSCQRSDSLECIVSRRGRT